MESVSVKESVSVRERERESASCENFKLISSVAAVKDKSKKRIQKKKEKKDGQVFITKTDASSVFLDDCL